MRSGDEKESLAPSSPPGDLARILQRSPPQERRLGTRLRRGGGDRSSGFARTRVAAGSYPWRVRAAIVASLAPWSRPDVRDRTVVGEEPASLGLRLEVQPVAGPVRGAGLRVKPSRRAPAVKRDGPTGRRLSYARVNRPGAALVLRRKHQRVLRRKHGRIPTVPGRKPGAAPASPPLQRPSRVEPDPRALDSASGRDVACRRVQEGQHG